MNDKMKELLEAVNRVKSLLDDPQFGMTAWSGLLRDAVIDNQKALVALGVTPASICLQDQSHNH